MDCMTERSVLGAIVEEMEKGLRMTSRIWYKYIHED